MSDIGQKLITEIKKIAEQDPDYVYKRPGERIAASGLAIGGTCMYVNDGKPSCIVGKAAWNIGLINAEFEESSSNRDGVEEFLYSLNLTIDPEEQRWLAEAQDAQDSRVPWGRVPQTAEDEINGYADDE